MTSFTVSQMTKWASDEASNGVLPARWDVGSNVLSHLCSLIHKEDAINFDKYGLTVGGIPVLRDGNGYHVKLVTA